MIKSSVLLGCLALTSLASQATPAIDGQANPPGAQTSTQNPGVAQTGDSTKPANEPAAKYEYPKMVSRDGVQVSADLDDLVRMTGAGVSAAVIKPYVETSTTIHPPTADEILYLHSHGIPAEVVTALISRSEQLRMQAA